MSNNYWLRGSNKIKKKKCSMEYDGKMTVDSYYYVASICAGILLTF
jgi:hypothetical protein